MNERIEKLLLEAHTQTKGGIYSGHPSEVFEKFAKLIVMECVRKVRSRQQFAVEDDHTVQNAFDLLVHDIEAHFGVEE